MQRLSQLETILESEKNSLELAVITALILIIF